VAAEDFAAEVEGVARASEHICALLPRTGAVITETLERARAVHDRLPREAPTFTHGDFKADHVWVSRDGLTLLDFGSCGIGDPARDVGKFLADLRWWSALSDRGSASARGACRVAERRTRALATSLLLVLPALLLGCRPKASYVRSEQGGYNLVATAPSVEQAVIRIRRTAEELCLERDYGVSEPQVLDRDFDTG